MYLLESIGGEHSIRLLLGGLLADLSAEHYSWVATSDLANPDVVTVVERRDNANTRLDVLALQGHTCQLECIHICVTLAFLEKTR